MTSNRTWGALCERARSKGANLPAIARMFNADGSRRVSTAPIIHSGSKPSRQCSSITTVAQLLQRLIYVTSENKYFDEATRQLHEPKVLDKMLAEHFPGGKKRLTASKTFDIQPGKRMVSQVGWSPVAATTLWLGGLEVVNIYKGIAIKPASGPVDEWLQLVRFVCRDYADIFLDHLAYTFQHPERKIRWQILIVSDKRRTGKSLIFRVVKQLLGNACRVVLPEDVNTGWGDYFIECKVLVIEELFEREGSKLFDKLKARLANDDVESLNRKGGGICRQQNLMSMYMTTNHIDALRFDEGEDKLLVLEGPETIIFPNDIQGSADFYQRVADWSDSPSGQAAAFHFLLNRDLSSFNPNRLPVRTPALKAMCEASAPDYQRHIRELIESAEHPFEGDFTTRTDIRNQLNADRYRCSDKGISAALKAANWEQRQAQEGTGQKRKARYWVRSGSAAARMTPSELWEHTQTKFTKLAMPQPPQQAH